MGKPEIETAAKVRRASGPRQPARGRGKLRYDALVDATDELLRSDDPDEVGLYRIAERAGVPPASVYHFFPTKEAAFTALAMRSMEQLVGVHREPIAAASIPSWQDLFRVDVGRARDFYNSRPAALKIFYGGYGGVDARNIDENISRRLANASYARLDSIYHMPFIREPEMKFKNRMAILDSIWSASVRKSGFIEDEYFEEAYLACVAYSRTFLPDRIEPRPKLVEAISEGQMLHIPYEDFLDEERDA